jgi:hypothetical protein
MRVLIRTGLALAALAALAACGTATAPVPDPLSTAMPPGPPPGSRAEATTLAGLLLSRLDLPPGALRQAGEPLPPSLSQPAYGCAGCTAYVDVHQLFAVAEPVASVVTFLAAHAPAGLAVSGTGQGSGPGTGSWQEVDYAVQRVPAGIAGAQIVVTVVAAVSGGSMLRADAQVTWYPPRTFAEYIDPDHYHALTITAAIYGGRAVRTVRAVVTSQAVIARLAEALDRSPAEPPGTVVCPAGLVSYQLAFSVSRRARPDVVVSAVPSSCPATGITVGGQLQPALADGGAVAALAGQALHATSRP